MGQRIGIYGGTFDPIHYGHLRVAAAVCTAFDLNRFLFVPAYVPPHKRKAELSSSYHRYAMTVLGAGGVEFPSGTRVTASTIELDSPSTPYTIETMGRLKSESTDAEIFFLMGADSFAEVNLWKDYERLLTEFNIIVAARPSDEQLGTLHLSPVCRERVVDLRGSKRPGERDFSSPRIYLTDYVEVDIAATKIREAVKTGQPITGMVPELVAGYIADYELYRNQA